MKSYTLPYMPYMLKKALAKQNYKPTPYVSDVHLDYVVQGHTRLATL